MTSSYFSELKGVARYFILPSPGVMTAIVFRVMEEAMSYSR